MESPSIVQESMRGILLELNQVVAGLRAVEVSTFLDSFTCTSRVFVAGAGRSGLLLRTFAMRLMHFGKTVYVAGDVVTPAIAAGDLLVVASGSGETGSLVGMARKAKTLGARLALVTANPDSTLAREADVMVRIPAPSPKATVRDHVESAQPMGNLFEQALFLFMDAVVMEMMRRSGMTAEEMFSRHANLE